MDKKTKDLLKKFEDFVENSTAEELLQHKKEVDKKYYPIVPRFLFGDIVIVKDIQIGIVVKTFIVGNEYEYGIFNRVSDRLERYTESEMDRFKITDKFLSEEQYIRHKKYGDIYV